MKALRSVVIALAALVAACSPAKQETTKPAAGQLTPIRFATDWRAEAST
jgi:NitT/TauT family transport system substrate-binding protein